GNTRCINQIAKPSSIKPNTAFTLSIQPPGLGKKPAPMVIANTKGAPMPSPKANKVKPPSHKLPLSAIYKSAPASGAVMQGPTKIADSTPIKPAPQRVPP